MRRIPSLAKYVFGAVALLLLFVVGLPVSRWIAMTFGLEMNLAIYVCGMLAALSAVMFLGSFGNQKYAVECGIVIIGTMTVSTILTEVFKDGPFNRDSLDFGAMMAGLQCALLAVYVYERVTEKRGDHADAPESLDNVTLGR